LNLDPLVSRSKWVNVPEPVFAKFPDKACQGKPLSNCGYPQLIHIDWLYFQVFQLLDLRGRAICANAFAQMLKSLPCCFRRFLINSANRRITVLLGYLIHSCLSFPAHGLGSSIKGASEQLQKTRSDAEYVSSIAQRATREGAVHIQARCPDLRRDNQAGCGLQRGSGC